MSFLGFTRTRLCSEVSCPRTLPRKNPGDPVRLEPRPPGLRVKHFTTEPCGTLLQKCRKHSEKRRNFSLREISPFPTVFSKDLFCRHVKTRACLWKGERIMINVVVTNHYNINHKSWWWWWWWWTGDSNIIIIIIITIITKMISLILYYTILILTTIKKKALENTTGKRENGGYQHFLLCLKCFFTQWRREIIILATYKLSSANAFNLVTSKILSFGKEPMHPQNKSTQADFLHFVTFMLTKKAILSQLPADC